MIWEDDDEKLPKSDSLAMDKGRKLSEISGTSNIPKEYGICSTCDNFTFYITRYGNEYSACGWSARMKPNRIDPVISCIHYTKVGSLSLKEMWEIATMIEPGKKRIGFENE